MIPFTFTKGLPLARPTFKIDPNRLRGLREESRLTQLKVAKQAHAILAKSLQTANETILSSYQRIERTGKTSKAMAAALAQVFETTVDILQGGDVLEDSADVISRIEHQLLEQKNSGNNVALLHAFAQHVKTYVGPIDEDDCMREFAHDIGTQIEGALIGQHSDEIARLAKLTGWTEEQLQQPGGVNGHWLLLTSINGSRETEIVLGTSEVMFRIRTTFEKWVKWSESDGQISLHCSLPWFHVEIAHPRFQRRRCKFSFVRCKPEVTGLKWVNPTWRDKFWLEDPLKEWAFSNANFFTDFDGKVMPEDVRRLKFRVLERNGKGNFQRVAYSKGYLEELPEDVLQNFKSEGNGHLIVINWLANGLAQSLAPYLTAYPLECWSIRAGTCHIAILLDIPYRLLRANNELVYCNGIKYSIDLVEETSPSVYRSVPWRDDSVADVSSLLKKDMLEKVNRVEHDDALQFLSLPVSPS